MGTQDMCTKQIREFCEVFARFMMVDLPPDWPVTYLEACWYLHQAFIVELYRSIERARVSLSDGQIAEMFKQPSRVMLYLLKFGYAFSPLTVMEKNRLVTDLLSLVSCRREGDIYCRDGRNLIWDVERVEGELQSSYCFDGALRESERLVPLLGRLRGRLTLYCEAAYPLCHPACHETHGCYQLEDGTILLVREYYDLRPTIWQFMSHTYVESVRIMERYRKIDISIDMINAHGPVTLASLSDNLLAFSIQANGGVLQDASQVAWLERTIERMGEELNHVTSSYSRRDWIRKIIEVHQYQLKPLKEAMDEDWRDPEMVARVSDKAVPTEFLRHYNALGQSAQLPGQMGLPTLVDSLMREYTE